ncbi:hypothetical protein VF21_06868 [Pseudogymnoascus sp. 05NY08]|nr:hypothetical protein VF21_06868 [Pseudogymnoascus sp. 05NY08]
MVIACILMFTLAELQLSVCRDWDKHIAGVKKIIELRGGIKNVAGRDIHLDSMLAYFMIIYVMSFTTSPRSAVALTDSWMNDQIQYLEIVSELYKTGLSTCFACPTELFVNIVQINQLRAAEQSLANIQQPTTSFQDILNHILQFSPLGWVATNLCDQNPAIPSDIQSIETMMSGWISIAEIYHAAVTLYCLGSLTHSTGLIESIASTSQARNASYSSIKFHLIKILSATDGPTQMRKLLLWPLVIAGIETGSDDSSFRVFITTQLTLMSSELGTFAPIEARQFLESHWTSLDNCPLSQEKPWDLMFDKHFVFVL